MGEIKLIALDLDGTLLDSQKRLSYKNEYALRACIQKGISIVPCTGRIWNGVPEVLRNMPGVRYFITVNGAVIFDQETRQVLDERKLALPLALDIIHMAKQFETMYDLYIDGCGLAEERFMNQLERYGVEPTVQSMIRETRVIVPDIMDVVTKRGQPVEKINYFFGDMEERKRAREALLARNDVVVSSSLYNNLEINALGATKGEGILRLAGLLGLDPEETMGIGDGENDITMMQKAGIGVAMGNAEESVKQAADYITLTNDEDGVANAIEHLVLNLH